MIGKEPVEDFVIEIMEYTEINKDDKLINILTSEKDFEKQIIDVQNYKRYFDKDSIFIWKSKNQPVLKINFK